MDGDLSGPHPTATDTKGKTRETAAAAPDRLPRKRGDGIFKRQILCPSLDSFFIAVPLPSLPSGGIFGFRPVALRPGLRERFGDRRHASDRRGAAPVGRGRR